ncbi:Stk1 family PASTA domain-containing Ser/Thr kinase [Lachnospiraceae bacterium oral taxon 500]|nr:Stk1 family PASTA domain-containing Ser/Thr kinase [Lachnospiraceae bacterium oral taxon 500]
MLNKGDLINNRYEIIKRIGTGGMSDVYKAKCHKLNRYVAIKILKPELCEDENLVKRFKVEAQAAAGLSHPNIVAVYDVGDEDDFHYIVMEYLEGKTLKTVIKERGVLTEAEIYHVASSVLAALSHAHNNHIIHRDIKPQNIFWTKNNKVKVMDFGIARVITDKTIDMNETLTGSVHYISPEQVKGLVQNEGSDIYSLGITMYEMATGEVPYDGDNPVNIALMHLDGKLPGICEKNPKISRNFETIIYKATEKKTINRYATAKEMLTDLKAAYQHPEEVIEYTNNDNGATLVIPKNEIKQIWSNKEYRSFGGEKDPYEKLIRWAAIVSAFVVVAILTAIIVPANIHNWVPKMVTVPDLFNLNVEELSLRYPDLKYAIEGYVYSDEVTRGRIVEQDTKPLESVKAESIIGVIVSKGVEEKPVPDVLNFSYSEAEKKLREQGFSVEQIIENNNTAAIGNVFRQSPAADSLLPKGGIVTIYVSKGAEVELVEVPPLINQPKQEAIARLTELGFIVNVSESYNDHYEKGRVVMMSIAPGNKVVKGSSIDLSVSLGKEFISKKMEIRINSPFGPVQESGIIKVTLTQGDTEKVLLETEVRIDQFPLMLTPEGTGTGIITVYLDGVKQYTRQIVFTEE